MVVKIEYQNWSLSVRLLVVLSVIVSLFGLLLWLIVAPLVSPPPRVLEDRPQYEFNLRKDWLLKDFVPDCNENYSQFLRENGCEDGRIIQYVLGPDKVSRADVDLGGGAEKLPNTFINGIKFARFLDTSKDLNQFCTPDVIANFLSWISTNEQISRSDVLTITYLSPTDPWSYCIHRDFVDWIFAFQEGSPQIEEHYSFIIWKSGQAVGQAECSSTKIARPGQRHFPHCNINLWFGRGDYEMSIGGAFPSVSFKQVITNLDHYTQRFWRLFPEKLQGSDINFEVFNAPVKLGDGAQTAFRKIESEFYEYTN